MRCSMSDDVDFEALRAPRRVKVAALTAVLAGFFTILLGIQSQSIIRFEGVWALIITTKLLLGGALLLSGVQLFKLRSFGLWGTVFSGALTSVLGLAWLVFSFANLFFSLMPVVVVPTAASAFVLAIGCRADVARADETRVKMEEGGMDLGM